MQSIATDIQLVESLHMFQEIVLQKWYAMMFVDFEAWCVPVVLLLASRTTFIILIKLRPLGFS